MPSLPHLGFVLEQSLGHIAFGMNLKHFLSERTDMDTTWIPIPFESGYIGKIPALGRNWTVRGSLRARRAIVRAHHERPFDALFIHTQTVSVFSGDLMKKVPTMLSMDATPLNYDEIAGTYGDKADARFVERAKLRVHQAVMRNATAFTTWSAWAKNSLVKDYQVPEHLVHVVFPGSNLDNFPPPESRKFSKSGPLQVLFVGGDFQRKGGDLLVDVCKRLGPETVQLHLVTGADVAPAPGIHVYRGVTPHSEALLRRYREADVFALPTRGDCLALVLGEAMASSLPIITTRVGGLAEEVLEGETGYYMDVDDTETLRRRLLTLHTDRELLERMGRRARQFGEERFDARKNANRIGDLVLGMVNQRRR